MEINQLKSILSRYGIRPNKILGQNFLLSEEVLEKIVEAADLTSQDKVLEIGPGLGFLTRRLAEQAGQVVAIEKDRKLCQALHKMFKNRKKFHPVKSSEAGPPKGEFNRVKIICGDALQLTTYYLQLGTGFKVVANIPYYLTGKILQMLLSDPNQRMTSELSEYSEHSDADSDHSNRLSDKVHPSLIVLLLQKEVAERLVAKPGEMSILSVSVQFYAAPEIIAYVPKENFYPMPEVDSAIVMFIVLEKPRLNVQEGKFFQLVKIGFSNKRKQLHNNLSALPTYNIQHTTYKHLFSSLGLNPLCRAQDLSLEDWYRLYQKVFPSLDGRG